MVETWEYKILQRPAYHDNQVMLTLAEELDELGDDRWELVSFEHIRSETAISLVLKRRTS